jgi:hypothetical protein
MVEAFPGGRAEGDVAHEADGAVIEAFADIDDATVRMVQAKVGALDRRVVSVFQANDGRSAIEAGVIAEPFVRQAVEVEPLAVKE